jgi:hypothetical protein
VVIRAVADVVEQHTLLTTRAPVPPVFLLTVLRVCAFIYIVRAGRCAVHMQVVDRRADA